MEQAICEYRLHDAECLLDGVELGGAVTEQLQLTNEARDPHREILHGFPRFERHPVKLLVELLAASFTHPVVTGAHGLQHVPGDLGIVPGCEHRNHIR
jgi:hypothetical protein